MKDLIILDVDRTLIYSTKERIESKYEYIDTEYFRIFLRPNLKRFLTTLNEKYDIAIWSCGSILYLNVIIDIIRKIVTIDFEYILSETHCDYSMKKYGKMKDLNIIWKIGKYNNTNSILLDDEFKGDNIVSIKPFNIYKEDENYLLSLLKKCNGTIKSF